jgi:hypothetical protein
MSNASIDHIDEVLSYLNENGEAETLKHFNIQQPDTLRRYKRKKRFWTTKVPKILLLDVENARMIFGGWRIGKQRVTADQIIKDWFLFGWSAKWLFESKIMSDFVTGEEAINRDDKRICQTIWKLVNDADVIIAHNGDRSDMPKLNTRFLLNGLKPPMPYKTIDTFKIAYKQFQFGSAGLNYLSLIMFRKQKLHTDYQLWKDCENGDTEQLKYMETYCKEDTALLENVYLELRPWIHSHPNLGVLMDAQEQCCPNCGSFEFEEGEGYYVTPQNRYISVRCKVCGAVNRKRDSEITSEQRKVLLIPNAR